MMNAPHLVVNTPHSWYWAVSTHSSWWNWKLEVNAQYSQWNWESSSCSQPQHDVNIIILKNKKLTILLVDPALSVSSNI